MKRLVVLLVLCAVVPARAISLVDIRPDADDPVTNLVVVGKLNNSTVDRQASVSFEMSFDDNTNPGIQIHIEIRFNGAYTTHHQNGERYFFPTTMHGSATELRRFTTGMPVQTHTSDVAMTVTGTLTSDGNKKHEFLIAYDSPQIPNHRGAKSYFFFGSFAPLKQGDINEDGRIGVDDLNAIRNNFGASNNAQTGDTNFDGYIRIDDLNTVRSQF